MVAGLKPPPDWKQQTPDDNPPGRFDTEIPTTGKPVKPVSSPWLDRINWDAFNQRVGQFQQKAQGKTYGEPNMVPVFGYQNYRPTTPPRTQLQTVEQMPNADKLTPFERTVYEWLPGFSQSSVGQALQWFGDTWAGKALSYLDVAAEGVERTLGFGAQALEAYQDPQKWQDFTSNLSEAWYAGGLAADVTNLPTMTWDEQGNVNGMRVPTDLPGMQGLVEARKKIAGLTAQGMDPGEALIQVRDEYYNSLGALQLRAQLYDTYLHVVGDPLNYILPALKPVEKLQAARYMLQTTRWSDEAIDVGKTALGLIKANKLTEAVELLDKAKLLDDAGRAGMLAGDAAEIARYTKLLAEAKGMTRVEKFKILITGGDTFKPNKLASKLNPFALTPAARAQEYMTMVTDNIGSRILSVLDEPGDVVETLGRALRGALGPEYGHAFFTPEGRAVQAVLGEVEAASRDLYGAYRLIDDERALLYRMAELLGDDVYKVANEVMGGDTTRLASLLASKGMVMDAGQLGEIGKMIAGVPLTPEMWKTKLANMVQDIAAKQGVLQFGVKARGTLEKLAMAVKSAETLAFLRISPGYLIRNVVNNEFTMLARGIFGNVNMGHIDDFWKGVGFMPPRLKTGFGAIGEVLGGPREINAISDALRGERGFLDKVTEMFNGIKLGKLDMGEASAKMESWARARAMTSGYQQGWKRYFGRPGKGVIDRAADFIDPAVRQEVGDGILKQIENIVSGSYGSEKRLDDALRGNLNLNIQGVLDDASAKIGFDVAQALPEEFVAKIEDGLLDAARKGQVPEFMTAVRQDLQAHLDELSKNIVETVAKHTAARIEAEGPQAFLKVWGDRMDEFWGGHMAYSKDMSEIDQYLRQITDPELLDRFWRKKFAEGDAFFTRAYDRLEGTIKGMRQGARKAGITVPEEVLGTFKEWKGGWRDFFKFREKTLGDFFEARRTGKPADWAAVKLQLDSKYDEMVGLEDQLTRRMDEVVAGSLPDPAMREPFLSWRNRTAELRMADKQEVIRFRQEIEGLSVRAQEEAWGEFWRARYQRYGEIAQNEKMGVAMLEGNPEAKDIFDQLAAAKRTTAPVEEGAEELTEGQRAFLSAGGYQIPAEGQPRQFIPDLDRIAPPPAPVELAEDQFWLTRGFQGLDAVEQAALDQAAKRPLIFDDLSDAAKADIERYLTHVKGQMGDARYASTRFSEFRADSALLNYNRRLNYNTWLGIMAPYEFWATQSMAKWALHSIDRPAMLQFYLRMREFLGTAGAPNQPIPSRLKGSIKIPLPFLPDWMGDGIFIDPLRLALPFDTFLQAPEQWLRDQSTVDGATTRLLDEWADSGEADPADVEAALDARSGPLWDKAREQAMLDTENDRNDTFDFMSLMTSPHAPLVWAKEALEGTPEDIQPFSPLTRMSRGVSALLGIQDSPFMPHNLEAKVRIKLGLPAFDKWEDYRVDRMLSNMAARGEITAKDALRAMIDREGDAFDRARELEGKEYAVGAVGSMLGMPAKAYPEGEFLQRSLDDDYGKALDAFYNKGDAEAINNFYRFHPEYETRKALWDDPETRLRKFMGEEFWSIWNDTPKLHKDQLKEQLGGDFVDKFLQSDRGDAAYSQDLAESVSLDDLQIWLKLMGGDPPGTLTGEVPPIELAPPEIAWRAENFHNIRNLYFPDWYDIQNGYYDLTDKGPARKDYLKNHPTLTDYWDWRHDWFHRNPDVVPYLTDDYEFRYPSEEVMLQDKQAQPTFTWGEWQQVLQPNLSNLVVDYVVGGEDLPPVAEKRLQDISEQLGLTYEDLLARIEASLQQ